MSQPQIKPISLGQSTNSSVQRLRSKRANDISLFIGTRHMIDRTHFTIVFEGDITKLKGNPLKMDTAYGKPVASGAGNAFDVIEGIHEIEDAATKLLQTIKKNKIGRASC